MSSKRNQRNKLWYKYVSYMHDAIIDLYVSLELNPFKLFLSGKELEEIIEKRRVTPFDAKPIVQFILYLLRLNSLAEELVEIIEEANTMLIQKRVLGSIEEWNVRGIIDWPNTLRNIIMGRPIAQKVISYTLTSPENLLLRAIVDYTYDRLKKAMERLEGIKKKLEVEKDISAKASRGLEGLKFLYKRLKKHMRQLELFLHNSFLEKIPMYLYTTESVEPILELVNEVEAAGWRPEWVDRLLDLVYKYYLDNELERNLDKIIDLVIGGLDRLIDKPSGIEQAFKIYSFKLYEIYNLYIVLRALKELGADIDLIKPKRVLARVNDKKLEVLYNVALEAPIKAIPDTTIKNKETIIIEAKFSRSPSYLSQGIFKVISYITLFKAKIGILTYPSLLKRTPPDEEDRLIYEKILVETNQEPKEIKINDEQKILVLQLKPLRKREKYNINIVKNILNKVLLL